MSSCWVDELNEHCISVGWKNNWYVVVPLGEWFNFTWLLMLLIMKRQRFTSRNGLHIQRKNFSLGCVYPIHKSDNNLLSIQMAMDQYLYIPFWGGWTSIYQLFWCSPGVQGFDTLPYDFAMMDDIDWMGSPATASPGVTTALAEHGAGTAEVTRVNRANWKITMLNGEIWLNHL